MNAKIHGEAEEDIERAFRYFETVRVGLGVEFVDEFRRGLELILQLPRAWQQMDETYRRYVMHRFSYGIIYRMDSAGDVYIVEILHLSQKSGEWRARDR